MKQYFLTLFTELLEHDRENEYVFFHNAGNLPELAQLPTSRWREGSIELKKAAQVADKWKGLDLYFSPLTVLSPRPAPVPSVVTIPDNQEVFFPEFFDERIKFIREWHHGGSARMADQVITISEFSKSAIAKHYKISPAKISVAHLCADQHYLRAREIARAPLISLPPGRFIFYPANRWPHKNHDGLLRALRFLALERNLKINAVFSGHDLADGYQLTQKAAEYGIGEQVFDAGYLSVEEMAYCYVNAEMLVFPSLFEGFGIPVVEAMTAGCPVVAARTSSVPEIGKDAAEYFEPDSPEEIATAIERVWRQPALRQVLIEKGSRRAADFSPQRLAGAHLAAFAAAKKRFSRVRYGWNKLFYQHCHAWMVRRRYPGLPAGRAGK